MLTKELLCLAESGYTGPLFTHTLSDIKRRNITSFQANTVTPPNITLDGVEMEIASIQSYDNGEQLRLDVLSGEGKNVSSLLYYACFDRDKNFGGVAPYKAEHFSVSYLWDSNDRLLSKDDIGKEVNVWLSTEPPP